MSWKLVGFEASGLLLAHAIAGDSTLAGSLPEVSQRMDETLPNDSRSNGTNGYSVHVQKAGNAGRLGQ
jgi:hypothetical protein